MQAGQVVKAPQDKASGLLTTGGQLEMQADLGKELLFPPSITTATQRPDIVLLSNRTKKVVMVELAVPWEERVEEAHYMKKYKYNNL